MISGHCELFGKLSNEKFGGMFKLYLKTLKDDGLTQNEDGFLTNKNSAAGSKDGNRIGTDEEECDIHTSSSEEEMNKKTKA